MTGSRRAPVEMTVLGLLGTSAGADMGRPALLFFLSFPQGSETTRELDAMLPAILDKAFKGKLV